MTNILTLPQNYVPRHMLTFALAGPALVAESTSGALVACMGPSKHMVTILKSDTLEAHSSIDFSTNAGAMHPEITAVAFSRDEYVVLRLSCLRFSSSVSSPPPYHFLWKLTPPLLPILPLSIPQVRICLSRQRASVSFAPTFRAVQSCRR